MAEPSDEAVSFSVVELDSQELAGAAGLWGIDTHNRSAHLGLSVRAGFTVEGNLRSAVWAYGAYVDQVVLGLLAHEWAGAGVS
ncbi:GNAT family protein [Streptomyces sp. NPDC026672]|uniref:GNAT family N-acetyltransferase n=1 Tax=unclassified Streptomyces TaxID=2593676 RepID=UPI0033C774E1